MVGHEQYSAQGFGLAEEFFEISVNELRLLFFSFRVDFVRVHHKYNKY